MNEDRIGQGIIGGSSGLAAALCITLLGTHWPYSPPKPDPVEEARRLQLGPSGPGGPISAPSAPSGPDGLLQGDLFAMRTYAKVEPGGIGAAGFQWLSTPEPGSWRSGAGRKEGHQDFLAYTRSQLGQDDPRRQALVLRAVGPWPQHRRYLIPDITRFLTVYFQRPVRWEDPIGLGSEHRLSRDGARAHLQYPTGPILQQLRRELPRDALAVVGITAADIYPASSWQFVFGLADLRERVAVVSHHRLHPEFQGLDPTPERRALASVRFLRVLAHEIAHTLGLTHCVTFQCIMNGCNSLDEQDQAPLHLCPVCLAKLAWRLRWRIEARYGGLAHLLYKLRLPGASRFFRRQFARLQPLSPTPEVLLGPRRATYTQRGSPPG